MIRLAVALVLSGQFLFSAANPPAGGSVRGTVVNAKTHEPLKRAAVFLADRVIPGRRLGCLSDANGQFVFQNVAPGRYRLEANKEGYVGSDRGGSARNLGVVDVIAGQEVKDIVYNLNPAAILAGRVTDDLGDPAEGAQVVILHAVYSGPSPQLMPAGLQTTNDRGEFRVAGLARGTYYVKATYRDPLQRSGAFKASDQNYGFPAMFYPGAPDLSQAAAVDLNEGDERTGIEIRLLRTRTFSVMGAVVNAVTNQPAAGVGVSLYAKSTGSVAADIVGSVQTDNFGRFLFSDVPAGAYGVASAASLPDGAALHGRERVDVSEASVNPVTIALRRGSPVKGVVQLENSGAIESPAAAQKEGWLSSLALFLRPMGDSPQPASSLRALVQPDGAFEVSDVPDDTYGFTFIYLPEDYYVKSARVANRDALRSGFATQDGLAEPVSIVLSSGGGRINGVVANSKGEPVSGAHVVIATDGAGNAPASFYRHVAADQNGRFSLHGMIPGTYQLIAVENADEREFYSPAFLARYARNSKKVTVEEKGQYSISLDLTAQE